VTRQLNLSDPIQTLVDVLSAFQELQIDYYIVGSIASSIRGEFRATNDVDVVCWISNEEILSQFVKKTEDVFFVDEIALETAWGERTAHNIIHKATCLKVDLFFNGAERERKELQRATKVALTGTDVSALVASAEDTVLAKMRWYRKSNETLDSQIRDIKGILLITAERLDLAYIREKAEEEGLLSLFESISSKLL